ncbi:MAG: AMP-binding protein [Acidobacteria bacterium]|nr:AMP-binding protein [Acidobacteriota bacterium]
MAKILSPRATVDAVTNLYDVLAEGFAPRRQAPMLVHPDGSEHTYQEIVDLAARIATVLVDYRLSPGDRVMVQVDKSAAAVALYLACLQTGMVYLPVNTQYTEAEVRYFRNDAEPSMFVGSSAASTPTLTLHAGGTGTLIEAAAAAVPMERVVERDDDDLAALLYTSGTTGRPKGAMLTHRALIGNARELQRAWDFSSDDVLVHALPIFHVHGLFVALNCALLSGCAMVFLPRFDANEVIAAMEDATVFMGVPTHYTRMLAEESLGEGSCANMRLFISGSAPMSEGTHQAFTARTGRHIVERYGLSEVCILTSNSLDGDVGSVGFALDGVELRVADDEGVELPLGETGHVETRPSWGFPGYWGDLEATADALTDDGFFCTGDIGYLDDRGRLTLEGRSSDMIISGGYNVYPREIEIVLDDCDGVVESAVIGVPHPDFGEAVLAVVVIDGEFLQPEVDDCLAGFKRPKAYVIVDELPRNAMGKVLKSQLRTLYRDRFESDS